MLLYKCKAITPCITLHHTYIHMKNKTTKSKTTNTNNVIQTKAEFNETVKSLHAKAKSASVSKMTESEIYAWLVEAEISLPKLIATIKSVKKEVIKEDGKFMKSQIGTVTGKFEKSKIKFSDLRKVVKQQITRVNNIKAISPIVSTYIQK